MGRGGLEWRVDGELELAGVRVGGGGDVYLSLSAKYRQSIAEDKYKLEQLRRGRSHALGVSGPEAHYSFPKFER